MARALVIPVTGPLTDLEVPRTGSLEVLQQAVGGGLIQTLTLPDFIDPDALANGIVNEEGKIIGLPENRRATDFMVPGVGLFFGDYITGPFILIGFRDGEWTDVPDRVAARARLIEQEAG
jgi:hypothetical protein